MFINNYSMDFNNCLKKFITRKNDENIQLNNIANIGLKPFEIARVERNGEYHGVEIEAIDFIYPLFTTERINKIYSMLKENKINSIIEYSNIQKEYIQHGEQVIDYIIEKWCATTGVECPNKLSSVNIDDVELNKRISKNVSHELIGKFKITGIGKNTKTKESTLPHDWIGKEFNGSADLHNQMNSLPSRIGKPPVTYCCTYGMMVQKKDIKNIKNANMFIVVKKSKYGCKTHIFDKKDKNVKELSNKNKFSQINFNNQERFNSALFIENELIVDSNTNNNLSTSYLSSLLQKCFRNQYATDLLENTIDNLHNSKGYNLPEHHFARVSGPKQLCWRSYISIIEDVNYYVTDKYLDLLDIFVLSLIFNECPKKKLNNSILLQLKNTLKRVQHIGNPTNWRNFCQHEFDKNTTIILKNDNCSRIQNSIILASFCSPMMTNDRIMLGKFYTYSNCDKIFNIDDIGDIKKEEIYLHNEIRMRAHDMHCYPYLLIQLQGCLPFIPNKETLKILSSFIWKYSSSFNTRYNTKSIEKNKNNIHILQSLLDIQYYETNKNIPEIKWTTNNKNKKFLNKKYKIIDENIKRDSFLIIFGRTYRLDKKINNKVHNIIICGNNDEICKVKLLQNKSNNFYVEGKNRYIAEKEFVLQFQKDSDYIDFKKVTPPNGYKWNDKVRNTKQKLELKLIKTNEKNMTNEIEFYVGIHKIGLFDGSSLLEKIEEYNEDIIDDTLKYLINVALYNEHDNYYYVLMNLLKISKNRKNKNDTRVFEWWKDSHIEKNIFLYVRSRIMMSQSNIIIGPCDRSGNKTNNSISYKYEGVIWRLMIMFSALYPNTIIPNTSFNFTIDRSNYGYVHLMNSINNIIEYNKKDDVLSNKNAPKLITTLWDHQTKSAEKIVNGFYNKNQKGFGDASSVGSGKTLVALSVMISLFEKCIHDSKKIGHSGFLVMLPTENLYDTWITEINKHTQNFNVLEHKSNGILNDSIKENTIIITTMGRCRDHPIIHKWLLVVIDECLTVQNKEALQTEEAWRQSSYSHFGVLMLSATFFRSRFDKMIYMLNMLNKTIPKTSEYLDTILSESIVCNLNENDRKWITNTNYMELKKKEKYEYNKIIGNKDKNGFEKTYKELWSYIHNNINYIDFFKTSIEKIEKNKKNAKILIYAASKNEADEISNINNNIHRYSISNIKSDKQHLVLSYAEGTFGLNNLIEFDTILSRPPEPDKLPQMKGRLDRPGQNSNILHIEYIVLKNTIEEASLYKLEICKNFYGNYIMPLAEYFKVALTKFN